MKAAAYKLRFGTKAAVKFFTSVLVLSGVLFIGLWVHNNQAEMSVRNLKERCNNIEQFRKDIIHYDEVLTMSARMAAATGDSKWEQRYREYEPKLTKAIGQAIQLSPEIYREETDRNNFGKIRILEMEHRAFDLIRQGKGDQAMAILFGVQYESQKSFYVKAIDRLSEFLTKQMEAALEVEKSKGYFARIAFITVLILMLLSWLIVLRIARDTQEALKESNTQLSRRMLELDELNHNLDGIVQERTSRLTQALSDLQVTHRDLKKIQAQMLQSEKFSAIGQLAAGIAHEINNPIGFINSNLQTMERYLIHYTQLLGILNKMELALKNRDPQEIAQIVASWAKVRQETNFAFIDDDIGQLIKESQEGSEKIRKIVFDLCALATPDKGMMDVVNLEALMESVLNIVWNEVKYKADVKKEFGQVPAVVCNPQKMSQMFVHLLINAADAIKDKGTITIRSYTKDDLICLDIADTGVGIAPEHLTNIFDPFFTTKPAGSGTGLGLSISYDIVRKHGGTITFKTKLGEGTTFTIMLPANCEQHAVGIG